MKLAEVCLTTSFVQDAAAEVPVQAKLCEACDEHLIRADKDLRSLHCILGTVKPHHPYQGSSAPGTSDANAAAGSKLTISGVEKRSIGD